MYVFNKYYTSRYPKLCLLTDVIHFSYQILNLINKAFEKLLKNKLVFEGLGINFAYRHVLFNLHGDFLFVHIWICLLLQV